MPESSNSNISRAIADRIGLVDAFERKLPIDMLTAELTGADIDVLNDYVDPTSIEPGGYFVLKAQGLPYIRDINAKNLSQDDSQKINALIETIQQAHQKAKYKHLIRTKNTTLLLPLEYGSHWYLLEINLTNTQISSISVWDPRKNPDSPHFYDQLAAIIRQATGIKSLEIQKITAGGKQDDNYSCGDWIVDEIERRCPNKSYVGTDIQSLRLSHISQIFKQHLQEITKIEDENKNQLQQITQKIERLVDNKCLTKQLEILGRIKPYLAKKSPRLDDSQFIKQVLKPVSVVEWVYAKEFTSVIQRFKNTHDKNTLNRYKEILENFKHDLKKYFTYEIKQQGSPLNLALIAELTKPSTPAIDIDVKITELQEIVDKQAEWEQPWPELTSEISDAEVEPEYNDLVQQLATIQQPVQPKNQSHKPQEVESSKEPVIVEVDAKEPHKETFSQPETPNQAAIIEASSILEPQARNIQAVKRTIEQTESPSETRVAHNLAAAEKQEIAFHPSQTSPSAIIEPKQLSGSHLDTDDTTIKSNELGQPLLSAENSAEQLESTHEKQPPASRNPIKKLVNALFKVRSDSAYQKLSSPESLSPNTDLELATSTTFTPASMTQQMSDGEDSLTETSTFAGQAFSEAQTLTLSTAARLIGLRDGFDKLSTIVKQYDELEITPSNSKMGLNLRAEITYAKIAAFKTELVNEINSLTPFLSPSMINQSQVQQQLTEFERLTTAATQLQTQLDLSKERHLQTLQTLLDKLANDVNQIDIEIYLLGAEIDRFDSMIRNNAAELEPQVNGLLKKLAQQQQAIDVQLRLSHKFADDSIKILQTKLANLTHTAADLKARLTTKQNELNLTRVQAELTDLNNDFTDFQTAPITPASLKQDYDDFLEKAQALAAKIPNPLPDALTNSQQQAYQQLAAKMRELITDVNTSKNAIDALFQQRKDSYNTLRERILSLSPYIEEFIKERVDPNQLVHLNQQAKDIQGQLATLRQQVEQDIAALASFADPSFAAEKTKGTKLLKSLLTIFAAFSREVAKKQTTLFAADLPLDFMRAQLTEPASYLKWHNSIGIVNLVRKAIEATKAVIPAEEIMDFQAAVHEFNTQHKLDKLQGFFKNYLNSGEPYKTYIEQINASIPQQQREDFDQAVKALYISGETDALDTFIKNHLQMEIQFKDYLTTLNNLTVQSKIQFNRAVLSASKGNYQLLSEFFQANPQVKNLFSNNQDLLKQIEAMWQSQRQETYKERTHLEPQNEPQVSSYRRAHYYLGGLFDKITEEQKKLEEAAEMRGDYSASQERNAIIENIFTAYQNGTIDEKLNNSDAKSLQEYEEESASDRPKASAIRSPGHS